MRAVMSRVVFALERGSGVELAMVNVRSDIYSGPNHGESPRILDQAIGGEYSTILVRVAYKIIHF